MKRVLIAIFLSISTAVVIGTSAQLPPSEARGGAEFQVLGVMYSRDAIEVWNAVDLLIRESGLATEARESGAGLAITRWRRFSKSPKLPPPLPLRDDFRASAFQFHVFVPQSVSPARVYVGSMVRARSGARQAHFYNSRTVELWFLDRLGQRLGERGEWIPDDEETRAELTRKLRPEGAEDPCPSTIESPPFPEGAAFAPPRPIQATRILPLYPIQKRMTSTQDRLSFRAVIREDGVVTEVALEDGSPIRDEFAVSGATALSLWRFYPARVDGCPVSVYFDIVVDFKIH